MRARALRALAAALAAACALSCTPRTEGRTVELVVWGVNLGPNDKGQNDVFREFERRNPGIRVKTLMMGSGGMSSQKLMTAIVGGAPPDVVYQDRFTLADWASRGAFRELDDLIERDRRTDPTTPTREQYFAATWDEASFGGKVYGVPWMADDRILVWNRSVFQERAAALKSAGLDPGRAPRTWTELLAYSRVLTEKNPDGTLKRAGFIPSFGDSWLTMYAGLNEAQTLSADGRTCTLDSPETVQALTFMKECYAVLGGIENADRFRSTFRGETNDAFFTGQVAMKIDGDWALGGIARYAPKLDFGSAPPPVPDDRFHRRGRFARVADVWSTWAGGFAYCIPRGARHTEAAWTFVKFVTSLEGRILEVERQDDLNRSRGQMTFPRLTAQKAMNEASLRDYLPRDKDLADAVRLHFALLPNAKVRPVSMAGKVMWDEQNRATDAALHGSASPESALKKARENVQRVLDEHFGKDRLAVADLRIPTVVGLFGLVIGAGLFAAWFQKKKLGPLHRKEAFWGLLFVSPWIIGFLVLTAGPMLASVVLAFTQYNGLQEAHWVGWKNFEDVAVHDRGLLVKAFSNAFYLAGIGVPLGLVTGLSLALLLNVSVRGIAAFRTLFMLPSIVPGVATVVLWVWILAPDPRMGLANGLWSVTLGPWFGLQPPAWTASEEWAKPALILMGLWGAGGGVIVWLAGLKGVPRELYEAASLDGATPTVQFWTVTLPQLSPLVFFNAVTGFIGALQVFDPVYVATGGYGSGPNDTLLVPVYHLFTSAFGYFRLGYASALAWVVFLVILAVTAVQFWIGRRSVYYEVGE
ncbi:MAG: extracellular solute-binding protein [Armatimonadetes bacterium]|nr:extracellular solute-binding protein [Armatimonadota bacterium]